MGRCPFLLYICTWCFLFPFFYTNTRKTNYSFWTAPAGVWDSSNKDVARQRYTGVGIMGGIYDALQTGMEPGFRNLRAQTLVDQTHDLNHRIAWVHGPIQPCRLSLVSAQPWAKANCWFACQIYNISILLNIRCFKLLLLAGFDAPIL